MRSWRNRWRTQTTVLVIAVGTAGALRPSIPKLPPVEGYNGCFDEDGALIRDLEAHVDLGKPAFSQLRAELKRPVWYSKNHEYGGRPKYLYHWTKKKDAKTMAKDRRPHILASKKSDGDAFLGEGVYMTAIPEWADPEVVRKNNYGGAMWKQFDRWHRANAYIRVDYEPLAQRLDIKVKADWQSNFCIRVPKGKLFLSRGIGAVICWDMTWDHKKKEWIEHSQFFDWEA